MAASVPAPLTHKGRKDGEPIIWQSSSQDASQSPSVIWKPLQNEQGDAATWRTVESINIIGLISSSKYSDYHSHLLFIENDKNAEEGGNASPISLRTLELDDSPGELLEHYQLLSDSYLGQWLSRNKSSAMLHIIVSVKSGLGHAKAFWECALKPFLLALPFGADLGYQLHLTKSEESVTTLARDVLLPAAEEGEEQFVIVMSGDGGVIDILNALYSRGRSTRYTAPNLAVLPMGTGNALANSSGIFDKTLGLRALFVGEPRELPVFRATFSSGSRFLVEEGQHEAPIELVQGIPTIYGAVVCSWGLHAALVADSDTTEYRKFGGERFKMAAKEALFPSDGSPPHAYRGKLSIKRAGHTDDWEQLGGDEHGYVLTTLVSNLEAGFTISPKSKPLDGVLHVIHFAPLSGQDAMQIMGKAYQSGKHIEDNRLNYEAVSAFRIELHEDDAHWRRICVDGKIVRVEKGGWVVVETDVSPMVNLIVR